MKPKRIFLIRHGQSMGNENPTLYKDIPDYALELTFNGIDEANAAGAKLKHIIQEETVFFYISPLWRTRSTAEQISKHFSTEKCKYREEPRIREQEWGHLRSKEETDLIDEERDSYGSFYYRFPDGESGADVYDRVSDFFSTLHRDFEKDDYPENVIIVTHGMTIRLFLMRWFHWSVEEFEEVCNPSNCDIFILEKQGNAKYNLLTPLKTRLKPKHPYQRPLKMF
jgi:broad specificity phosphatase PhoE